MNRKGGEFMSEKKILIEQMVAAARKGHLSRRSFMQYATAAGVTITTASGLWTSKVAAATPKRSGTFRHGVHDGNTADQLDPGLYQSVGEIQLSHTHRSYLTMIAADNGLAPDLATSWSATPDAKVWTFELSDRAHFHNGKKAEQACLFDLADVCLVKLADIRKS